MLLLLLLLLLLILCIYHSKNIELVRGDKFLIPILKQGIKSVLLSRFSKFENKMPLKCCLNL